MNSPQRQAVVAGGVAAVAMAGVLYVGSESVPTIGIPFDGCEAGILTVKLLDPASGRVLSAGKVPGTAPGNFVCVQVAKRLADYVMAECEQPDGTRTYGIRPLAEIESCDG